MKNKKKKRKRKRKRKRKKKVKQNVEQEEHLIENLKKENIQNDNLIYQENQNVKKLKEIKEIYDQKIYH